VPEQLSAAPEHLPAVQEHFSAVQEHLAAGKYIPRPLGMKKVKQVLAFLEEASRALLAKIA
jgi:hypothetical protein